MLKSLFGMLLLLVNIHRMVDLGVFHFGIVAALLVCLFVLQDFKNLNKF